MGREYNDMKKIEIEIDDNTSSEIADILCWLGGYLEAKKDDIDFDYGWLKSSLNTLKDINNQIKRN